MAPACFSRAMRARISRFNYYYRIVICGLLLASASQLRAFRHKPDCMRGPRRNKRWFRTGSTDSWLATFSSGVSARGPRFCSSLFRSSLLARPLAEDVGRMGPSARPLWASVEVIGEVLDSCVAGVKFTDGNSAICLLPRLSCCL